MKENKTADLVYICIHNSRRSHFGQVWAIVAAQYFGIKSVQAYSGGTEATAFHINAIRALERTGMKVKPAGAEDKNPVYHVRYDGHSVPIECFSKTYDDPGNPRSDFAAIMTCGEADADCPLIPGVELRVATTYDDPKTADKTPQQDLTYDARCKQIATETFYVFSKVQTHNHDSQ